MRLLFGLWCGASVSAVASLGAAHWYSLPAPQVGERALARAVAEARSAGKSQVLLHVLYAECACSRRIFTHLTQRRALPAADETVLLVDGSDALQAQLRQAGYRVVEVTPEELESRYGVSAAPLLVIALKGDTPQYVGGYTERKQGLEVEDLRILARLERGESPAFLPLFGCAVSERLQRLLDPMGLKYGALRAKADSDE
jgi:hypothetical protein